MVLTSSPVMAATASLPPLKEDPPTYGPSSVFNSTPYLVTVSFLFSSEDPLDPSIKCTDAFGGANSGSMFTSPHPRGKCEVVDLHVEAQSAAPGGGSNTVGTVDWIPPAGPAHFVSDMFNTWAVTWVQDGSPTGHPGVVQVVDQQ